MPSKSQTHSLTKYLAKAINSPSSAVPVTMKVSSFFERNQGEAEIPRDQSSPAGKQTPEKKKEEWKKALSEDAEDDASSAVSDISASTEGDVRDQGESLDERSETFQRFEKTLRAKHTKACKAMSSGAYKKALSEFESILSDLLGRYGERHERIGAALHNVAIANLRAGSLDDAMDAIEEAIKIRSRALGRSHPRVADSLVELGIILLSMDENNDALKVFERALKLRREERDESFAQEDIDESNLKIAKVLNNIGCVNFEAGSFGDARRSFDDAIELQKTVFKSWFNLVCGVDGSSPGILTMASTMCNKSYVEIEQDRFVEAIVLLEESLKIQRSVLGADNKLVQSTLDNLGYAYFILAKPLKALNAYENIWSAMRGSKDCLEEKLDVVKKLVICHISLEQWSLAFPLLEVMEDMQRELDSEAVELERIQKLMGEVNYQIFKLPSLSSATNRALGCAVCMGPDEEDLSMEHWVIEKPDNTSKMSGHRVTHA